MKKDKKMQEMMGLLSEIKRSINELTTLFMQLQKTFPFSHIPLLTDINDKMIALTFTLGKFEIKGNEFLQNNKEERI